MIRLRSVSGICSTSKMTAHAFRTHRLVVRCNQLIRSLSNVPSSSLDLQVTGQCNISESEYLERRVKLSPMIRLKNSSITEIRSEFLKFFRSHRHELVAPSTVYPKSNEGSYFVNAGMNQFKPIFLDQTNGIDSDFARLRRAVNSQPCIRMGGRLDDLNDVGYDSQHLTMFEMLGTWSFGDYDKAEACRLLWTFVTKILGLPTNAIYVTYFGGNPQLNLPPDDETRDIWLKLGVLDQKLLPFGVEHNFWRAGQSSGAGLCGPATEIHVDFNALADEDGLLCARCLINTDNPQVMELWNCVFISHRIERGDANAPISADNLTPLPKQFVDTGMGLERLSCILQGAQSVYDCGAYTPLFDFINTYASSSSETIAPYSGQFLPTPPHQADQSVELSVNSSSWWQKLFARPKSVCLGSSSHHDAHAGIRSQGYMNNEVSDDLMHTWHRDTAYRILADHSRALAHILSDGLLPGRQGLALKVRQLIHRAARAAILTDLDHTDASTSCKPSLLACLVEEVARKESLNSMSDSYVSGPSARRPSSLSFEEMRSIVDQEVRSFSTRLTALETAFHNCLNSLPDGTTSLNAKHVQDLMEGKYGCVVSWDLLCAQSRWYGLASPSPNLSFRGSGRTINSSGHSAQVTSRQSMSLARQLHLAGIPLTDDAQKYSCQQFIGDSAANQTKPMHSYDFSSCKTRLLAVFVPDSEGNGESFKLISGLDASVPPLNASSQLGLVFKHTNFFSPSGGQDGDQGSVNVYQSNTVHKFNVHRCDFFSEGDENGPGWIIHWAVPDWPSSADSPSLKIGHDVELSIDINRRFNLASHHTGQHLFTSALELVSQAAQHSDGIEPTSLPVHGGSVHPDSFVVNASLPPPASRLMLTDLSAFVKRIESTCSRLIQQRSRISTVSTDFGSVSNNPRIRQYPWVSYPAQVRMVRIGDDGNRVIGDKSISVELCGGTHLASAADLQDIVIVSIRSRQQAVKQFTAVVGEAAVEIRRRAESIHSEVVARCQTKQLSDTEIRDNINWITSFLDTNSISNDISASNVLPLTERLFIEDCVTRMRQRKCGVTDFDKQAVEMTANRLLQHISDHSTTHSSPGFILAPVSFDNYDLIIQAVLSLPLKLPLIAYNETNAICYIPVSGLLNSKRTALDTAHELAARLSSLLSTQKQSLSLPDLTIKARPLRSRLMDESNKHDFALLQLFNESQNAKTDWHSLRPLLMTISTES